MVFDITVIFVLCVSQKTSLAVLYLSLLLVTMCLPNIHMCLIISPETQFERSTLIKGNESLFELSGCKSETRLSHSLRVPRNSMCPVCKSPLITANDNCLYRAMSPYGLKLSYVLCMCAICLHAPPSVRLVKNKGYKLSRTVITSLVYGRDVMRSATTRWRSQTIHCSEGTTCFKSAILNWLWFRTLIIY